MLRPVRTVAPAVPLIILADAKVHLKVELDDTDEDTLIQGLIDAAVARMDGYSGILGRCLLAQQWSVKLDYFHNRLRLPFPDVTAAVLKYFDTSNVLQTVSAESYQLLEDELGAFLEFVWNYVPPNTYYRPDAISLTITAGYGADAAAVPAPIKQAMLLLIGHWYANRESVVTGTIATALPQAVDALIGPYRRVGL